MSSLPITHMEIPRLCTSGVPSPLPDVCLPARDCSMLNYLQSNIIHKHARPLGNVVTKSCFLGKSVMVRGDIAAVSIGFGVFIDEGAIIRPPLRHTERKTMAEAVPVTIGNMVYIGANVICEAMKIENFVIIESGSIIGERAVIRHGAQVRAGSVVPPGAVVPPFTIVEGNPAQVVARVQEDIHPLLVRELIAQFYQSVNDPLKQA